MNRIPAWLTYSLLRLGLFFVPFLLMLALGTWWWLAAVLAAVLSFALSLVLLRGPREQAATELYQAAQRRANRRNPDDELEDAQAEQLADSAESPEQPER